MRTTGGSTAAAVRHGRRMSATVPGIGQSEDEVLAERARVWRQRPLTRDVYRRYFEMMRDRMATGGRSVELGGGSGMSREFLADTWVSDLVKTRFVDFAADAARLPLRAAEADNLLMIDLIHHLPRPARLFDEAVRVLRPGGRMILVEPYISPASRLIFRLGHPEPVDLRADPLPADDGPVFSATGAFASNQAIPSLLFGRDRDRFERRFPALRPVERRLFSVFVYPLSGGFSGPCLIPRFAHRMAWSVEGVLLPLRRLLAFRILVVLERV
jgi:SAM-dependent methyltransferase